MATITSEPVRAPGIKVADSDCPTHWNNCGQCFFRQYGECILKQKKKFSTAVKRY